MVINTIPHAITTTTTVLIAVARFESISSIPIFASIDVAAANIDESIGTIGWFLEDENGKFFTWNKNKIYIEDWIRIPMKEVKNKFENKEHVSTDVFCQAILTDGIDNVRFLVPLECYTLMGMFVD